MASSWKSLSGVPSFTPDTMLLMTDGTVLVHDAGGKDWYRLKPDSNGKYDTAGVTWSGPFSMAHTRQFYASGVLADGRVFALGGEYSDAGNDTPLGEIFDPQTNTWSPMSKPTSFSWIQGDVSACILADGRVLFGALTSNRSAIWDPAVDTWIEAGLAFGTLASTTKLGTIDEETWSLLPDGTVLTVDISSPPFAEKYVPTIDTWVAADQAPATLTQPLALLSLTDTTVTPHVQVNIGEIGPAILLPDGRLFFIGATGPPRCTSLPQCLRNRAPGARDTTYRLIPAVRTSTVPTETSRPPLTHPPCCCLAARFSWWAGKPSEKSTTVRPSSGPTPRRCSFMIHRPTA